MKSFLTFCPAMNEQIVQVTSDSIVRMEKEGKNCTFGFFFGVSFPGARHITDLMLKEVNGGPNFNQDTWNTLNRLISSGIHANDAGLFAVARLYLSKALRFVDSLK